MPLASGSGRRAAMVVESVWGTTPSTPVFDVLRFTNGSMRTNKTTATSDEIRADRNVTDEILLGLDSQGSYDFEFSYGNFTKILESVMFSDFASDVLKNGISPKSFTVEETRELGATDSFSRFTGCRVGTFSLNLTSRQKVTGSFSMMGRSEALATAIVAGATYTAPNTNPILSASAHVADLGIFGMSTSPKLRSLTIEMNNGLRIRPVVGDKYSLEHGEGRFEVTGTMEAYFESNALYQKVLDHDAGALEFTIGADTGEKYTFEMPNVKVGNGEVRPAGNDEDIVVAMPYRALYDAGIGATLQITRAVA